LHDADDRKYFKPTAEVQEEINRLDDGEAKLRLQYCNACTVMQEIGAGDQVVSDALEMIGHVSTSANGNSVPEVALSNPEFLWPRFCDRLEAIGPIGAVRCYQYNTEIGAPLAVDSTPKPQSERELWEDHVVDERFINYQQSGGKSESMMDHYYDKLL